MKKLEKTNLESLSLDKFQNNSMKENELNTVKGGAEYQTYAGGVWSTDHYIMTDSTCTQDWHCSSPPTA